MATLHKMTLYVCDLEESLSLDEIKRITKEMPRWSPGRYNGKEIDTECSFRLRINNKNY